MLERDLLRLVPKVVRVRGFGITDIEVTDAEVTLDTVVVLSSMVEVVVMQQFVTYVLDAIRESVGGPLVPALVVDLRITEREIARGLLVRLVTELRLSWYLAEYAVVVEVLSRDREMAVEFMLSAGPVMLQMWL